MRSISPENITCPDLINAVNRSDMLALSENKLPRIPDSWKVSGMAESLSLTTKGGSLGKSKCLGCSRLVQTNHSFKEVEGVINDLDQPVKAYNYHSRTHTVQVGGIGCTKDPNQR